MDKKLQKLKDRLSDLSKRNRSLRLLKLYDKWAFDLTQLGSRPDEILDELLKNQGPIYLVSHQSTQEDEQKAAHRLLSLFRSVTALEEETGLYSLYVGYPFISGRLSDDTFIQAPVFLFPVRLERKADRHPGWVLSLDPDAEAIMNRTLLLAIRKYAQLSVDEAIFDEAKQVPETGFEAWACDLLNEYGVKCKLVSGAPSPLPQYTQKEIPATPKGKLEIRSHLVLGHFPQGNTALIKDYEDLLSVVLESGDLGLVNDILLEEDNQSQTEGVWDSPMNVDSKPQEKTFNILDLDASQEEVIHSVDSRKGIVVHGPPGTGKSQTIVNLVSNALAKNERILVVCQKRAALDVVYQRLESRSLAGQVALVHDPVLDRKSLYLKLANIMDDVSYSQAQEDYAELSKEIDRKTKYFNRVASGLWAKQGCGLSAFELYSRSKSLKTDELLLNLGSLPDQIEYVHLQKLLPIIKRLGNYFGKYGHEGYSWVDRQGFSSMDNAGLYELRQILNQAINQAELALKQKTLTGGFDPGECWANEGKLAKGIRRIESYNQKAILSNISLWFWAKFAGKQILAKLAGQGSFTDFKSEQWKVIEKAIVEIHKYGTDTRSLNATVSSLGRFLKANVVEKLASALGSGDIPLEFLRQLQQDIDTDFDQLVEMDSTIEKLGEIESELLAVLLREIPAIPNPTLGTLWQQVLEKSFYTRWVDSCEKTCPEIKHLSTGKFDEMLKEYRDLLQAKRELTPKLLKTKLKQRVVELQQTSPKHFRELRHQVGKMRRVWPVRKLVAEFATAGLLDLLPVWLVSPETVSAVFPLIKEMFDLVIFDEASQCPVENGVPAFYRAKQVVVAGDEKQLPPFDLFKVSAQDQEEEEYSEGVDDSDSLLNLSKRCYPTQLLAWHYRSKYEELINFSNHAFYGGQVQIAPNVTPYADPPAIEWISVDGLWENNCNQQEAKQVVDIIKRIFQSYPDKTVGVITFNSKQQEKIQDYVDQLTEADLEFNALYHQVMARDVDSRLFIKNIENVQGDERDIIIFSIAYGRNLQGRVSVIFGTLNRQGGENRLNVAITRGKEKVIVVSSVGPEDFDVSGSKNLGPVLFKQYLRYAHAVAHKDRETVNQVLQEVNQSLQAGSERPSLSFDSPFEQEVYDYLNSRGYTVDTQIGCSGYRIDLAILDPKDPSRYILGVECDGAMYHSAKSARERDIYRQRFLQSKGWNITRIWSRNWWQNPQKEINRLEDLLNELAGKDPKSEFQVIQASSETGSLDFDKETYTDIRPASSSGKDKKTAAPEFPGRPKVIKVKQERLNRPAEVVKLESKQSSPSVQLGQTGVDGKLKVSFGDRVTIEDVKTLERFDVDMEDNPYNRHLMSQIQKLLLGRSEGASLSFGNNTYTVAKIIKSPEKQRESVRRARINDELY